MYGYKLILAVAILGMARPVLAAPDATLYFSGEIILPSCTVDKDTINRVIPLGTVKSVDFASIGSTQNPAAFDIKLIDCAPGTNVTMTVTGTIDTVPSVLKNAGTAGQVGVQLLKANQSGGITGTELALNSAIRLGTVPASNTMTIPLVAQFYRLGTMTAGSVTTKATVNFTYD